MAKKLTPEQVAELNLRLTTANDLSAEEVAQLQALCIASQNAEIENAAKVEELTAEVAELQSAQVTFTKKVEGSYKAKDGKKYEFATGYVNIWQKGGTTRPASEILKDSEEMEKLIAQGYGGIQEVEK